MARVKQSIETIKINTKKKESNVVGQIIWKNGARIGFKVLRYVTEWRPPRLTSRHT